MNKLEEIKNLLINLGADVSRQNIDMVIQDLSLVVEPEKPKPGSIFKSPTGEVVIRKNTTTDDESLWIDKDGSYFSGFATSWDNLTPARVISDSEYHRLIDPMECPTRDQIHTAICEEMPEHVDHDCEGITDAVMSVLKGGG